jgi:hypothetical protein
MQYGTLKMEAAGSSKYRQNFYQSTSEKMVFLKNNMDASIMRPLGVT